MKQTLKATMLAAMAVLAGCMDFDQMAHERELNRRGIDPKDLDAPPNETEIRARVLNDVRNSRLLEVRLDEGKKECFGITFGESKPTCARDETPMVIVILRSDSIERQHPVQETAFYCPTDTHYWYHYQGGKDRRDVWMGPFPTRLRPGLKE